MYIFIAMLVFTEPASQPLYTTDIDDTLRSVLITVRIKTKEALARFEPTTSWDTTAALLLWYDHSFKIEADDSVVAGFGARLPPDGQISHAFFVNGHPSNPYCERIDGKWIENEGLIWSHSVLQSLSLYFILYFAHGGNFLYQSTSSAPLCESLISFFLSSVRSYQSISSARTSVSMINLSQKIKAMVVVSWLATPTIQVWSRLTTKHL